MKSWHLLSLFFYQLASFSHALALQPRQDVQTLSLQKCPNIPFSCQQGTECLPTTSKNTTVVCCPSGSNCNIISQIPCDISQQNATEYPNNQVHTTQLDEQLPTCDSQCCPLGYNCAGNLCVIQPQSGSSSSAPSLVPPVATAGPSTTVSSTMPSTTLSPIVDPADDQQQHSNNTKSIAIGVPVALVLAGLLGVAILWFLKRRKRQQAASSYVNEKPLRRMSSHSTEFMGRTPRPLSLPQQYVAPMSRPSPHSRSHSEPQAKFASPAPARSDTAIVSEPMWNAQLSGGTPVHRTDFLLRRGSVETGYEGKVKPSWSTRKARPKSLRCLTQSINRSATEPKTPVGKSPRRTSRLTPLFSTPLRFGLPLSPSPAKNKAAVPASRPPRSDESLARLVRLEGKTVARGEAKRISNATPSPKKAKKMRMRDRSESATRPLVANAEGASRGASVDRAEDRNARGQSLERHDSDASATTIESATSDGSNAPAEDRGRGQHKTNASTETINVLLPPPSVFHTPPPPRTQNRAPNSTKSPLSVPGQEMQQVKRETTFENMMEQAGWRRSEWLKK